MKIGLIGLMGLIFALAGVLAPPAGAQTTNLPQVAPLAGMNNTTNMPEVAALAGTSGTTNAPGTNAGGSPFALAYPSPYPLVDTNGNVLWPPSLSGSFGSLSNVVRIAPRAGQPLPLVNGELVAESGAPVLYVTSLGTVGFGANLVFAPAATNLTLYNPGVKVLTPSGKTNLFISGADNGGIWAPSLAGNGAALTNLNGTNLVGMLVDAQTTASVNWQDRTLMDNLVTPSLNWQDRTLIDTLDIPSLHWEARLLYDVDRVIALDWNNRRLFNSDETIALAWGGTGILGDGAGLTNVSFVQATNAFVSGASLDMSPGHSRQVIISGTAVTVAGYANLPAAQEVEVRLCLSNSSASSWNLTLPAGTRIAGYPGVASSKTLTVTNGAVAEVDIHVWPRLSTNAFFNPMW